MKKPTYFESTEYHIRINVRLCHWSMLSGVHLSLDKGKIRRGSGAGYGESARIKCAFLNATLGSLKRRSPKDLKTTCANSESTYFFNVIGLPKKYTSRYTVPS
jgi:hypothetical protein